MAKTRRVTTHQACDYYDFGCRDQKGRAIGATITRLIIDYVPTDNAMAYDQAPGRYYAFVPSVTRDRREYGASQMYRAFDTVEARDKAVDKYLKSAQARALKKFGPSTGG